MVAGAGCLLWSVAPIRLSKRVRSISLRGAPPMRWSRACADVTRWVCWLAGGSVDLPSSQMRRSPRQTFQCSSRSAQRQIRNSGAAPSHRNAHNPRLRAARPQASIGTPRIIAHYLNRRLPQATQGWRAARRLGHNQARAQGLHPTRRLARLSARSHLLPLRRHHPLAHRGRPGGPMTPRAEPQIRPAS